MVITTKVRSQRNDGEEEYPRTNRLRSFGSSYGSSQLGLVIWTCDRDWYRKCLSPGIANSFTEYADRLHDDINDLRRPELRNFYPEVMGVRDRFKTRINRSEKGQDDGA